MKKLLLTAALMAFGVAAKAAYDCCALKSCCPAPCCAGHAQK